MTWVRIDDGFSDNGKIMPLSDAAKCAYVDGLCWCNRMETDGFISLSQAKRLAGKPRVIQELTEPRQALPAKAATRLWEPVGGGFVVHDYLDYQPSHAQLEKERADKSAAGKAGAAVRWGKAPAIADGMAPAIAPAIADGWQDDAPVPDPVPSGLSDESPLSPKTRAPKAVRHLAEADVLEAVDEWPLLNVTREAEKFRDYIASKGGNERGGVYRNERAGFRNWLRREEDRLNERNNRVQTTGRPNGARPVGSANGGRTPTKLFG